MQVAGPIFANPILLPDGSHRGMNAGHGPPDANTARASLVATTWTGMTAGRERGVDSSHWNGTVVPTVGRDRFGITWWAHKATEGTSYVDPTFKAAQAAMRAAGIRYRVWYHFPRNNQSIPAQVDHFLRTIGPLWVGEAAKLDDEAATGIGALTIAQARQWHELVEAHTGRPTVQYTGGYVRNPADNRYHWDAEELREGPLGHRANIFASYNSETTARGNARGKPWDVWQLTSSAVLGGIQSGGITVIDLDRLDNPAAYDLACGYGDAPTPPAPVPPVVVTPPVTIPGGSDMPALRVPQTVFDSRDGFGPMPAGWDDWIDIQHPEIDSAFVHITVVASAAGWVKVWDATAGPEPKGATVDFDRPGTFGTGALVPVTGGRIRFKTSAPLAELIIIVQGGTAPVGS